MSRTLKCGFVFCGEQMSGTLQVPDEYFDGDSKPIRHLLNSRLSAQPTITYGDDPVATDSTSLLEEHKRLTGQVAQLTQAVRGLVTLISVLDKKVDTALKGGVGADFAVL